MRSMKRCRFVVIPSLYEACPMILLESMCLGKIPIMFDLPYAREFTKNGQYGVLAKDAKDMLLKITSIHRQGDMEHLSKEIRNFSRKEYDMDEIALKYYHLFGKL
jgi:glycosyltransferase involved in cell wall biosynthesis